MKTINITEIEPDSYYSEPVFLDEKYILTTSDIPVPEDMIERLKKWHYKIVFSDGEAGQKPVVNSISGDDGFISSNLNEDLAHEETKQEAQVFFREICGFLENIFETYRLKELISQKQVLDQVKKIIQVLKEKRDYILDFSNLKSTEHNYLISHSVKTTIICIALAEFLIPPHRTIELGMGAMMHKIGMLKINDDILTKTDELEKHEWKAIQAYPILGFKILKEMEFPAAASMAVLEHQERVNGTGYPRKVSGDQISLYGKILGVVSSYCAAIEKRPFKEGKNAHLGIMDILKDMGKQYDDKIVKALVFTLSIYPIGTVVQLTNKSIAIVTKTTPGNPKQPVIKVLTSEEGERLTEKIIVDLSQNKKIQIVRPLTQGEIEKI